MKGRLQHQGGGPMPPTWDEIRKSECETMGRMIGLLSWRDPRLRARLSRYLEKLQKIQLKSPVPAE